jgi:hypothetical protein
MALPSGFTGVPWYTISSGSNTNIFGNSAGFTSYAGPVYDSSSIGLSNGKNQASSVIISNFGAPFFSSDICPSSPGSFSLQYAFSLSAAPSAWNGISDGLALSFIDATAVASVNNIQWKADVSNVLVPNGPAAVTLQIDTKDDCCGTANQPCTGTYTTYDNQHVAGCGTGYRLASPQVQNVPSNPLQDYAMTNLAFGGRYTSMTHGTNLAGVAVTGGTVMSQVDFNSTGPNGQVKVSWYING